MSRKLQHYSLELKAQAVRMAIEDGLGIQETAKRLSIPAGTLAGWTAKIKKDDTSCSPSEQILHAEEMKRLRMECEILKKAAAYFARESLQGMPK